MATVVIPFAGACPHRERALDWVLRQLPYPVKIAAGGEPFVKARAVMPAVAACPDDVVVVHDADVWTEGLESAVMAVACGAATWAVPHKKVYRLSQKGTEAVLVGEDWQGQPLEREPYRGLFGGGVVVAHRDTLLAVPLDARFVGWGNEDESWGVALATLAGKPWRGTAPLVHLYHPLAPKDGVRWGSKESQDLFWRYSVARRNPAAMRELLEGAA